MTLETVHAYQYISKGLVEITEEVTISVAPVQIGELAPQFVRQSECRRASKQHELPRNSGPPRVWFYNVDKEKISFNSPNILKVIPSVADLVDSQDDDI